MVPRSTVILLGMLSLAACESRNLYVAHDTVVGVNAQLSADRQQGRLVIGYDRDFVAIVPKSVPLDGQDGEDAMALLNCTELEIDGIFLSAYTDSLASGEAAIAFAKKLGEDGGAAEKFFNCHERLGRGDDRKTGGGSGGESSAGEGGANEGEE